MRLSTVHLTVLTVMNRTGSRQVSPCVCVRTHVRPVPEDEGHDDETGTKVLNVKRKHLESVPRLRWRRAVSLISDPLTRVPSGLKVHIEQLDDVCCCCRGGRRL